MWQTYAPLVREVNSRLTGFSIRLESALTDTAFDSKLRRGQLDSVLVEPHRVLDLEPCGYSVFARGGNRDRISGLVIASKSLKARRPADLRGKVICFSSPGALASTMLVKVYLKRAGVDPERQMQVRYTGSSESSLLNVVTGHAAAAGVPRDVWERFRAANPISAAVLDPLWQTDDLPGSALMVHSRVPKKHVSELRKAVLQISRSETGRRALQTAWLSGFAIAESGSYDELWEFVLEYSGLFGKVPDLGGPR